MDKKLAGKYAGLTGAVALVLTVICQITHDGGIPWLESTIKTPIFVRNAVYGSLAGLLVIMIWKFTINVSIFFGKEWKNLENVLKDE